MKQKINCVVKSLLWLMIPSLLVIIFTSCIGQPASVIGESMCPTLKNGDEVYVNKLKEIERFDVVIVKTDDSYLIKRIIGLPGETVAMDAFGNLEINYEAISDSFGGHDNMRGDRTFPVTLGENEYFVMGDNRSISLDSRYQEVGNINKEDILGVVTFSIYPFNKL